jgi:hypothetical protein
MTKRENNMGPIQGFILLAILIGGSALATDKANGAELPEEVDVIHTEVQVYVPDHSLFKEYLRYNIVLPTAVRYRVDCYSDGSGRVSEIRSNEALYRTFTSDGRDLLRAVILDITTHTCLIEWEKRYDEYTLGEGNDAWYF